MSGTSSSRPVRSQWEAGLAQREEEEAKKLSDSSLHLPEWQRRQRQLFSVAADDTKSSNSHRLWIWSFNDWAIRKTFSLVGVEEDFRSQLDQAVADLI